MSEKIIDEVMGLVDAYAAGQGVDSFDKQVEDHDAIRAKLREVLDRKPMSEEDAYELTHSAGPELVALGQKWADNEIHAYQYAHQAEAIVTKAVRDTERFHSIGT